MTAAVLFLWAGCLYSIARWVLWLVWTASFRRQLLVLAVALLAVLSSHLPSKSSRPPA